jgi:hypothetical protein
MGFPLNPKTDEHRVTRFKTARLGFNQSAWLRMQVEDA